MNMVFASPLISLEIIDVSDQIAYIASSISISKILKFFLNIQLN